MKRWLSLIFILMCAASAYAAYPRQNLTIVFIAKSNDQGYWDSVREGVDRAIHEFGDIKVIWRAPQTNSDTNAQIRILRFYERSLPDAIIIDPTDRERLVEPVASAARRGIKMIVVDSPLNGHSYDSYVATDNYGAGQLAAKRISESIRGHGNVAVFRTVSGSGSTDDRADGFIQYLQKHAPLIRVVSDLQAGASTGDCMRMAMQLFSQTRNIDAIFAVNETSSEGVLWALRRTGLAGRVRFVGFDSTHFLDDGLQLGDLDALVVQDAESMGYLSVKEAVDAIHNRHIKNRAVLLMPTILIRDEGPAFKGSACSRCPSAPERRWH